MFRVDHDWVRRELDLLFTALRGETRHLFEPEISFYERLRSGEETDLQEAIQEICEYLSLPSIPSGCYEWGLNIPMHVAGQIRQPGTALSLIQIPLFYVGKPYLIGAILAHEVCHQLLALKGIWYDEVDENECLTDLACFASGLGKLTLNGMSAEASDVPGMQAVLGYIGPELNLFAYMISIQNYGISPEISKGNILNDVAEKLGGQFTVLES